MRSHIASFESMRELKAYWIFSKRGYIPLVLIMVAMGIQQKW